MSIYLPADNYLHDKAIEDFLKLYSDNDILLQIGKADRNVRQGSSTDVAHLREIALAVGFLTILEHRHQQKGQQ